MKPYKHEWGTWWHRDGWRVVFDACVLVNLNVVDLFLRLAERAHLIFPVWSQQLLDEAERTLVGKLGWSQEGAAKFCSELIRAFPNSMVSGRDYLIERCNNHPKDRHVLAAAIETHSRWILTFNLNDFREEQLQGWSSRAIHPDDLLLKLWTKDKQAVLAQLRSMALKRRISREVLFAKLARHVPKFVARVLVRGSPTRLALHPLV